MSNVESQQPNMSSTLGTSVAFSGIMTGGFGSLTAVKKHGGIKNAIKATKENNKFISENYLKNAKGDTFTKNIKAAYNYQDYTRLAKQKALLERKAQATKLPLFEKFKNIFRKDELTLEKYKANYSAKSEAFNNGEFKKATDSLKKGESISDEVLNCPKYKLEKKLAKLEEGGKLPFSERFKNLFRKNDDKIKTVEDYRVKLNKKMLNASTDSLEVASTFAQSTKGLLKAEFKDPLGIFFAVTETFSRFTSDVIPTFKNEGFLAGLKEIGKALVAGVATWATDAGFSVVLRTLCSTIGSFAGPVGMTIGSIIGNAIGGVMSSTLIQKLFPTKEQQETVAQNIPEQAIMEQPSEQVQVQQTIEPVQANSNQDIASKYAHLPDKEQIEQMAYAQAFKGANSNMRFYA